MARSKSNQKIEQETAFAHHLQQIEQRWPETAKALLEVPGPVDYRPTATPQPTIDINGIHLSSGYDRQSEAHLQASLIPNEDTEAWVYGIGSGDLITTLLQRDTLQKLHVVILNPAVAAASLTFFDHQKWLVDPRVTLSYATAALPLQRPFAAVPACLQLADDNAARLRDQVFLELSTPFIREKHGRDNSQLMARLVENRDHCQQDGDAASLFDCYPDSTILVAGAGPSLADCFPWIRRQQQADRPLVAVSSALKPLLDESIVPQAVVVVDPGHAEVLRHFEEVDLGPCGKIPLVYFPSVHRDVLAIWPGPLLTAYPEHPLYRDLEKTHPKQKLFSSGSVLHPAIDLAVGMGADTIVLLGADFGFPNGYTHVAGSVTCNPIDKTTQGHWVHDKSGNRIPTTPNMRGFLRDLERYIEKHPEIHFLNASSRGAFIKGTTFAEESL